MREKAAVSLTCRCGGTLPRWGREGSAVRKGAGEVANNYCAVPHAYLDECDALTDAEFGRLMRGLLRYSRDGTIIEAEGNERFFARRLMNQEDIFNEHYEAEVQRRITRARLAAEARWAAIRGENDGTDA